MVFDVILACLLVGSAVAVGVIGYRWRRDLEKSVEWLQKRLGDRVDRLSSGQRQMDQNTRQGFDKIWAAVAPTIQYTEDRKAANKAKAARKRR